MVFISRFTDSGDTVRSDSVSRIESQCHLTWLLECPAVHSWSSTTENKLRITHIASKVEWHVFLMAKIPQLSLTMVPASLRASMIHSNSTESDLVTKTGIVAKGVQNWIRFCRFETQNHIQNWRVVNTLRSIQTIIYPKCCPFLLYGRRLERETNLGELYYTVCRLVVSIDDSSYHWWLL